MKENDLVDVGGQRSAWADWWETIKGRHEVKYLLVAINAAEKQEH